MNRYTRNLFRLYTNTKHYSRKLKDWINANKIGAFVGIIGTLIAGVELYQSYQQSKLEEIQRDIEKRQRKILNTQTSLDTTQTSINALGFVREYINGYVYQYGQIRPSNVDSVLTDIRSVGLPAIAAPSQYSVERWIVMTHSMGEFENLKEAEEIIMSWRDRIEGFEEEDKAKTRVFERYEEHLIEGLGASGFVFRYKADILNHKEYFVQLARSEDFRIDVVEYSRSSTILRSPSEIASSE